jgi:thiamine biosynthesis lipoprotein
MGTVWQVDLLATPVYADETLRDLIEGELESLVAQMSHWRADSDLSRFNQAAAGEWVSLPDDLFHVLATGLAIREQTNGAFDPAIGAAVDSWGFGPTGAVLAPPPASPRRVAIIEIDSARKRALQPGGARLDLSAIGKGFAVDRIAELLDRPGVSSYLVEIGGELKGCGIKPDAQPWWVAIERPPDFGDDAFDGLAVGLCGWSIASTGDYRRYFEHAGQRYTHTIDPRTGSPARGAVASVTVLHPQCMLADAYSTALAVMGPDEGLAFADRHRLAAFFLMRDGTGNRTSAAFRAMLE